MKKHLFIQLCLLLFLALPQFAGARELQYVDATSLTVIGKLFPDTPNPYHRLDTDVYYVTTTDASDPRLDTTVDGTHPGDYGYTCWAESIKEPVLQILAKYGIK